MHFNEKTLINLLRFNLLALFVLLVFERRLSSQTVNESKSYSIQSNSNTTDSASKILAQIGRLASKNVPIKVDTTMTLVEELNPEFDWNLQRPVDEAIRSLKKTGRPAFKFLIENIDNKSFSRPVLGSIWVNQSVGGVCKAIISSQVDLIPVPDRYSRRGNDGKRHYRFGYFQDAYGGDFKRWWVENQEKSLREMQLSALAWQIDKESEIGMSDETHPRYQKYIDLIKKCHAELQGGETEATQVGENKGVMKETGAETGATQGK